LDNSLLIVEDEALASLFLSDCLESAGYMVTAAVATGNEAIASAAANRPAIALVDILLKGDMDGIATAKVLRSIGDIPVIFTTGQGDPATRARADAVGHAGYILKPFTCAQIVRAVQRALPPTA